MVGAVLGLAALLASGSAVSAITTKSQTQVGSIARGGSLVDLAVGSAWPGLDPATNTQDAADSNYENAIFGQLFQLEPGGKIVPSEATGYQFADHGLQFEIFLRHGIKFSDGTPFTAQAVQSSIQRDLLPANSCLCLTNFTAVSSITTKGSYEVILSLSKLDSPILSAFIGEAPDWTVDPSALASMGEAAYAQNPVGAGPFKVIGNAASATLVLKANPSYFIKGEPYLKNLTFTTIGNDTSAYEGLQAGQAQMVTGASTIPLLKQIKAAKQYEVYTSPATGFEFVSFNTFAPPFNNPIAREAIAYATNAKSLVVNLYGSLYKMTESPSAPGDLFYEPVVPGARTFDLAKAQALVHQLGGLTVTLGTLLNTAAYSNEAQALAAMWSAAGIKVNVQVNTLQTTLIQLTSHSYQALDVQWGQNIDNGVNDPIWWSAGGQWSGVSNASITGLLNQGVSYTNRATRTKVYDKINQIIDQNQYDVFLYSHPAFTIAAKSVQGVASGMPVLNFATMSVK